MQFIASTLSFILLSGGIYSILIFLFPQASAWQPVIVALAGYAGVEALLIATGKVRNFFELVDNNQSCGREIIFLMGMPLILAVLLKTDSQRNHGIDIPFGFILGGLWFVCAFHTYVNYTVFKWLGLLKPSNQCFKSINFSSNKMGPTLLWAIAIVIVIGAAVILHPPVDPYGPPQSIYQTAYATLQSPTFKSSTENYLKIGVWYAGTVPKSAEYPQGLGRISTYSEMGHGFLHAMAINCNFDVKKLYWNILILGCILVALNIGVACRSLLGFVVMGISLVVGSTTFLYTLVPARLGMVEMLVLGMAFVISLPLIIRYWKYSDIIWWSLVVGMVSGIAGLMRQNTGLSILVASMLVVIIFAGFKRKKAILTLTAVIAILCGNAIISTTFKGILWYRDVKLEITAPTTSIYTHGAGFPLLGGIGGVHPPDAPAGVVSYPNALDMAFHDPVIYVNVFNESPLVFYTDNHEAALHQVSFKILQRYILEYPFEFVMNMVHKTYLFFLEEVFRELTKHWLDTLLVLIVLGSLGNIVANNTKNHYQTAIQRDTRDIITSCWTVIVMAAVVPILTSPHQPHARHETVTALFITIVIVLYLIFFQASHLNLKLRSGD